VSLLCVCSFDICLCLLCSGSVMLCDNHHICEYVYMFCFVQLRWC